MGKNLSISSYIRKPFLIYDFAPDPIWISLYIWGKFCFLFYQWTVVQLIKNTARIMTAMHKAKYSNWEDEAKRFSVLKKSISILRRLLLVLLRVWSRQPQSWTAQVPAAPKQDQWTYTEKANVPLITNFACTVDDKNKKNYNYMEIDSLTNTTIWRGTR